MSTKKAIDKSKLNKESLKNLESLSPEARVATYGIAGDNAQEPIPKFISTPSENVINNKNNSWIVLGRDRPASRLSGYGGKGDTQAASIDLVVGRMGFEVKEVDENGGELWTDPNFKKDAARIYISQKTDVDKNFGIVDGKVGNALTKSTIALKADGIRVIAREGIKLITKTDIKNSQGGKVETISGVDILAGNNDKELQPMVKGDALVEALNRMVHHIDKLNGIVDAFLMTQMKFNEALTHHFHYSPYFAMPTTPSIDTVVPIGTKTLIEQLTKIKRSLMMHKTNLASYKMTYLNPAGAKYINSRWNNVN
jgi:hypothetical protein